MAVLRDGEPGPVGPERMDGLSELRLGIDRDFQARPVVLHEHEASKAIKGRRKEEA